jgi:pimeloyl-ACP methyl ester carboxylesterase
VVSRTLTEPLEWQNSTVLQGDVAKAVAALKQEDGGDLLVIGSTELVQTLIEHDLADDVQALADRLGLERFAVVGFSAGGGYALACAARLPDRISAVGLACCEGPYDEVPGAWQGWMTLDGADAVGRRDTLSRRAGTGEPARRTAAAALLAHLRAAHGAQLGDSGLLDWLADQAADVHAAMHNSRAHPGHFLHRDRMLRLWEATARIDQVDTGERT